MKKKIIVRCLFGAPIGLAVCYLITVIISLTVGDGTYYAVAPQLVSDCGSELKAVLLQTVCSLLYGAAWAGASVVWEQDRWGLLRMTITHLVICSLASFPIAYFMYWMPHDVLGILSYYGIFFAAYFIIWIANFFSIRRRIRQFNEKVSKDR